MTPDRILSWIDRRRRDAPGDARGPPAGRHRRPELFGVAGERPELIDDDVLGVHLRHRARRDRPAAGLLSDAWYDDGAIAVR